MNILPKWTEVKGLHLIEWALIGLGVITVLCAISIAVLMHLGVMK